MHDHPAFVHPDLLVGTSTSDDAGVYRIASDRALVHTVDFFTPIVDDPYDWGRIAAANALSDVYAMGGTPMTALQLVGWPRDDLGFEMLTTVLRGGADVMAEAGCVVVGGHSIDDREPKYGFAVTGEVHPDQIHRNVGARVGDALVLTKPLGTGIIATAVKAGRCPEPVARAAVDSMASLNAAAVEPMKRAGVHAVTDVTGFGLGGHLLEILNASGVGAVITGELPVHAGVYELLTAGFYPGGSVRNLEVIEPHVSGDPEPDRLRLLADAQTSGGLLMSVAESSAARLLDDLTAAGVTAWEIGAITDSQPGSISFN